jgi:hypothetical protein
VVDFSYITTQTLQRYVVPCNKLGVLMKSDNDIQTIEVVSASPQKIFDKLSVTIRLNGHVFSTRRCDNLLTSYEFPCHLEKRRRARVNNR